MNFDQAMRTLQYLIGRQPIRVRRHKSRLAQNGRIMVGLHGVKAESAAARKHRRRQQQQSRKTNRGL